MAQGQQTHTGEVVISGAEGLSKTVFSEALSWLKLETDKGPLF